MVVLLLLNVSAYHYIEIRKFPKMKCAIFIFSKTLKKKKIVQTLYSFPVSPQGFFGSPEAAGSHCRYQNETVNLK